MTRHSTGPSGRDALAQDSNDATTDDGCTRRRYVQALGAGAVAGVAGSFATGSAVAQSSGFDSFVQTDGRNFTVDGQPIYFNGSNNFWLTDASNGSQDRIDRIFDLFEQLGIDLVRMWANGAGGNLLQPSPREHDEQQLRLHDYAVQSAGEHGIRLIPSLVDNWDHEGGILQYSQWAGGNSRAHFYQNQEARDIYRNHVETMVTRENYYTGVEWREDPTIVMWELANEPRLEADSSGLDGGSSQVRSEDRHREILGNWIQDMSAYIKDLDSNHLVSTGSEGHFYRQGESYPDGTWGGQDFVEHHSYDTIDAASFHWYPDHWWCHDDCNDLSQVPLDRGPDWIQNHAQAAHDDLGIPAYLGEFNVRAERPNQNQSDLPQGDGHSLSTRQQHLQNWYQAADDADLDAMLAWQVVLSDTMDHDGFQIYPEDTSADYIRNYADVVEQKSDSSPEPPEPPASPADLRTDDVTETTIELAWDAVSNADHYNVSRDGTQVAEPPSTTHTLTGLSPDTTYALAVEAENDGGTSGETETDVTTLDATTPVCQDAEGGTAEVDGQTVCDVNDDGYYRDVDADGSVGQSDVAEFFTKQHRSAWKQPDMFDFSENGAVTHGDVVDLFDYVALQ